MQPELYRISSCCFKLIKYTSVHADKFGQPSPMICYDRVLNERNAIPALNIMDTALSWYRLNDGVNF